MPTYLTRDLDHHRGRIEVPPTPSMAELARVADARGWIIDQLGPGPAGMAFTVRSARSGRIIHGGIGFDELLRWLGMETA